MIAMLRLRQRHRSSTFDARAVMRSTARRSHIVAWPRQRMVMTAASALLCLSPMPASSWIAVTAPYTPNSFGQQRFAYASVKYGSAYCPPHRSHAHLSRRYASSRGNGAGGDDDGILSKITETARNIGKSMLPSSWFQSEAERNAALQRQKVKDDVSGSMKELLKDAPLPLRMMGNMMAPLMGNIMSGMAETMESQQQLVEAALSEAQSYLIGDATVRGVLGEPIEVGAPMSQSTSTQSINGQTSTKVDLAFPVTGSRASGMARLAASDGRIQQLQVQADGRVISVSLTKNASRGAAPSSHRSFRGGRADDDDNVIDAEIIEKQSKK